MSDAIFTVLMKDGAVKEVPMSDLVEFHNANHQNIQPRSKKMGKPRNMAAMLELEATIEGD